MKGCLPLDVELGRGPVGVVIPTKQQGLVKDHASVPDGRGSAEKRRHHLADHRLDEKKQGRADKHGQGKKDWRGHGIGSRLRINGQRNSSILAFILNAGFARNFWSPQRKQGLRFLQ